MKKFLSLVLALIMTMSLVTISAGATEYRDLTDKEEIQYAEAVAVLNRIGVITGYEDGSFRPETELTRGAAAKIIVSLMIGPDAASALPNNASPYPDVPAGHTFAGVIGYCKTAGYISGYGDGTFKPANPLTGYAFAKMLLGAVGYKSSIEGFVDTGWTMNVARIGNVAGLFDRLDFDGAAAVTRDEACQLALNTLKATMVDYGGSNTVVSSTGEVLTVQGSKAQYVTSNNRDINANINRRVISAQNNELTLEFGEEHFKDLRLEHDKYDPAYDIYGHPSNEWSYKKVTIGTFKLPADFTYTDQIVHREATAASKEKALGLRGYDTWSTDHSSNWANWSTASSGIDNFASPFANETQVHINGWRARVDGDGRLITDVAERNTRTRPADVLTLSEIADLTDNGVTVEVYVCPVDADFITDVVVTRTQLMEVDRVATDYVRLADIEPDSRGPWDDKNLGAITGYNAFAIDTEEWSGLRIEDVKDDNYDAYKVLKDMKAGDKVAVIPYTEDDGATWEVGEAYAPEVVSGALTRVDIYNSEAKRDGNAIAITVGGTSYKINEWNKDMMDIKSNDIKATRKDVDLYLAKDGTALWVDEVGNAGEWMIVGDYYQGTNDAGKVVWYVHGWTTDGTEVDLDLGTIRGAAEKYAPGELVRCQINTSSGGGEYVLTKPNNLGSSVKKAGMYDLPGNAKATDAAYTHPWEATGASVPSFGEGARAAKTETKELVKNWEGIYRVALGYGSVDHDNNGATAPVARTYSIAKNSQYILLDGYGRGTGTGAKAQLPGYKTAQSTSAPERATIGATANDNVLKNYVWDYQDVDYASGVKFIYVSFDSIGEVESLYIAKGKQDVDNRELRAYNTDWRNVGTNNDDFVATTAEAYVNDDGNVETVVIKTDSADADLSGIRIITKNTGANIYEKSVGADATETELIKGRRTEREYVQGPDFKENKVGIFDTEYDVGDILIGNERNGIFYAREFHGDSYRGNSLDGLWIKGVDEVENTAGETLKDRFKISGSEVRTLDAATDHILKGAADSSSTNQAFNALLIDNPDEAEEIAVDRHQAGVILAGSAIVVDVRVGHEGEITKIKDLFDYDLSKVELKVLLNGKTGDAGFRSAYVIVILDAPAKKDDVGDTSTSFTGSAYTKDVNAALQNGDVTITDSWAADNVDNTYSLVIPAGRTLRVNGSLNVDDMSKVVFGKGAKLIVSETLRGVSNNMLTNQADVTAKDVIIAESCEYSGKMTVDNTLTVNSSVTWTVTGTVTVQGTSVVSGPAVSGGGTIEVHSVDSLHITGNVSGLTIKTGNGSDPAKNGRVVIAGTLASDATFQDNNVKNETVAAPKQEITTVKGSLTMSADAKLSTEEFDPAAITLSAGATITLEKGAGTVTNENITLVDGTGLPADVDPTAPVTVVVGGDVEASDTSEGPVTVPVEEQGSTEEPVAPTAPFTAVTKVVTTVAEGKKFMTDNGATETQVSAFFGEDVEADPAHCQSTMPWLMTSYKVARDIPGAEGNVLKLAVKVGDSTKLNKEVAISENWAKDKVGFYGWEIVATNDENVADKLGMSRGSLSGTYGVDYTWTISGVATTTALSTSDTYEEPEALTLANVAGNGDATVTGRTIKINSLIDVATDGANVGLANVGGSEEDTVATIAGEGDKAAIVFTVSDLGGIYKSSGSTIKFPNTPTEAQALGFNEGDGLACAVLYVNSSTLNTWKSNPTGTITLTLKPVNTASPDVTLTYTLEMSSAAWAQADALINPPASETE